MMRVILILSFLFMSACSSVPMAQRRDDVFAKNFFPTPGKANIYVYRDGSFGAAIKTPLRFNGTQVAEMTPATFAKVSVEPGEVVLATEVENREDIRLVVEPDQNYFIRQSVRKGKAIARVKLIAVSEREGQNAILDCEMVKSKSL